MTQGGLDIGGLGRHRTTDTRIFNPRAVAWYVSEKDVEPPVSSPTPTTVPAASPVYVPLETRHSVSNALQRILSGGRGLIAVRRDFELSTLNRKFRRRPRTSKLVECPVPGRRSTHSVTKPSNSSCAFNCELEFQGSCSQFHSSNPMRRTIGFERATTTWCSRAWTSLAPLWRIASSLAAAPHSTGTHSPGCATWRVTRARLDG